MTLKMLEGSGMHCIGNWDAALKENEIDKN